ncbi:hypothetical protein FAZ19_18880 [Sphingobacterium alkalisoli]|uniref:Uncharacterized protein n=1 Tax=Sphingobacterium alkalisoli TaxID=1874115 RepID=A0A4U0GWZ3_9SPHI|nr:hypothetical protein [Sphingobacterium alkalisoli]TJY63637.1 hypothetical protein FAZ19_18880 [Sphingobacterium alkalisoli]
MNYLLKYYFLNYYDFFYKRNSDERFAVTRALNLLLINISFLIFSFLVFLTKFFPELKGKFPAINQYGIGYFVFLIMVFGIHYLMSKKLKKLILDKQEIATSVISRRNKIIVFLTIPCIFLVFILMLFI